MKLRLFSALLLAGLLTAAAAFARQPVDELYDKAEYRIAMRDSVKLYTAVYTPKTDAKASILIFRTPYGCAPYGPGEFPRSFGSGYMRSYIDRGYIVVMQDVRGRFMSEGEFVHVRPAGYGETDETTDSYDTVEWLVKHVPHNNGRVGFAGSSYPGFYAMMGGLCTHPAVKAVSPQAPVTDWYMGDDVHHNGVLMLTTRSGEEGVSVNYSNNTTFMSPFLTPAFQNTYGAKDGYYASWGSKLVTKQSWTPTDFYQTGYNTSNSVGLSFGGKKSQTYVSAGVVTAEGIIPNNEYNRYNFTANHSSSFLDERMHLSVLGMYMNVNEQNMLSSGQYYNPMIPVYLMSPSDDIRKYAVYERYNASRNFPVQYWPWGSQSLQMQNPYWITNRNMFNTGKDRFLFGASLKYDVTDWLDITGRARIDYTHITAEQKNYASTLGLFAGDKGRYYNNTYTTSQRYADVLANVHKTFADGAFSLNATLGASIEDYKHRAILLGGDLTGVPNLFTLANMTTNKSQAKETINDQTQSLFATLQLGYKNMVFLSLIHI